MKILKTFSAVALAGALTAATVTFASAQRWERNAVAAGAGFAAGAIIGTAAVATGRAGYYGPGYSSAYA
jgi:hypothetical protein